MPSISLLEAPVGIPGNINAVHWQEWENSGIAPQIIAANLVSLEGDLPFDRLCSAPGLARTNSGRLTTAVLKRYSHIEAGGWWCNGLDPEKSWDPMLWGCFKPDQPRIDLERGKTIKYEHPLKTPTRAFFLLDPDHPNRWAEVQAAADRPILIVEGVKKAGALISLGYDAIALPGVFNGRRVMRDGAGKIWSETLIPELALFAQAGRPIYFCFDHDAKANTRQNVNLAIATTGRLLQQSGCSVSVITLPGPEKGVDDFIVARGSTAFAKAFTQAQTLNLWQWQWQRAQELKQTPNLSVRQAEFKPWQESTDIPDSGILVLSSPKGTGKTKAIVERIQSDDRVIALGHRIALMRNLCDRMGLDYRSDLDEFRGQALNASGLTHRVGLCVDSLGRIDPEEFRNGIVVIDEFMQVLRHLLLSDTCDKNGKRPLLLARFQEVIRVAKLIILADADAADIGINYIRNLRNQSTPIYLIQNTYRPQSFPVKFLQNSNENLVIEQILKDLNAGKRLFIATDSISTSEALNEVMSQNQHQPKGLLINSKTSSDPDQRAFITDPNQEIEHYDWIIATPSLTTGVSIETPHIDVVYGLFYGVITDGDAAQALSRVRDDVPRIIWCTKQGKNFHKLSTSTKPNIIHHQLKTKIDMTTAMLRLSLGHSELLSQELMAQLWQDSPHVQAFTQLVAQTNESLWSLRDRLQSRLASEGSQITLETIESEEDPTSPQIQMKEVKQQAKLDYQVAIAKARIISKEEIQTLKVKEAITPEDKLNIEKTQASDFLATNQITPEDIAFYQEYRQALPQLEALLYGTDFALAKDVAALGRQAQWEHGLLPFDMRFEALKQFVRDRLGLLPFLEPGRTWSNEDLEPLGNAVRSHRQNVKEILGFTVPAEKHANNGWIFQRLCLQLGLKVRSQRLGPRGKQKRFYRLDPDHYQTVITIIHRRHQRRLGNSLETSNSPPPMEDSSLQSVVGPIELIVIEGDIYGPWSNLKYGFEKYKQTTYSNLSQKFQETIDLIKKIPRPPRNSVLSLC
jgi:Domain of unknown function (DUF3854)